jgi:subtilisin family serine protease
VNWQCKLMVLKVTNKAGDGYYRDWAQAIMYAVQNGAKVINMSVGGTEQSSLLQAAVDYAWEHGVLIVACAMNGNTEQPYYPAACRHVLAVGATNPDDTRAAPFFWDKNSGSNYGKHLGVVAPGNYIYGLSHKAYNAIWGGTSQAAPFVSGLASLLLAQNPHRTPAELIHLIESTADDQVGRPEEDTPGWDKYHGFGRINALKALQAGERLVVSR